MDIDRPLSDGVDGAAASLGVCGMSPEHAAPGAAVMRPPTSLAVQPSSSTDALEAGGRYPVLPSGLDCRGYDGGPGDPAFDELLSGASARDQWLWGIAPVGSCSTLPMLNEDGCPAASGGDAGGQAGDEPPIGLVTARKLRGRRMRSASVPNSSRLGGEARAARQELAVSAGDIRAIHSCRFD
jgi:hypothetical protein